MSKRSLLIPALISVSLLAACGGEKNEMRFYPTTGPLSQVSPLPVITAKLSNADEASGDISLKLPDIGKCTGTWSTIAPRVTSRERGLNLSLGGGLGGKIGGKNEAVGGVNTGQLFAVCKDGTRVEGYFMMGSGTTSGNGTATDTAGNSYKVLF